MVQWAVAPPVGDRGMPPDVDSHAAAPCGHADGERELVDPPSLILAASCEATPDVSR
jgi:hypothetical protein